MCPSFQVQSNYPQLEAILKGCVSADSTVTEGQLRIIIRLVTALVTEWWEARSEPVMILWEHYHRRLNSAFFVPGVALDTIAIMRYRIICNLLSYVNILYCFRLNKT
jgi:hypothetical protein